MKVGIFLKTTSGTDKQSVLNDFAKGVKKAGDAPFICKERS